MKILTILISLICSLNAANESYFREMKGVEVIDEKDKQIFYDLFYSKLINKFEIGNITNDLPENCAIYLKQDNSRKPYQRNDVYVECGFKNDLQKVMRYNNTKIYKLLKVSINQSILNLKLNQKITYLIIFKSNNTYTVYAPEIFDKSLFEQIDFKQYLEEFIQNNYQAFEWLNEDVLKTDSKIKLWLK